MGITTSKNTRRISFDNTFATTPELIQKPTDNIMSIDSFEKVCILQHGRMIRQSDILEIGKRLLLRGLLLVTIKCYLKQYNIIYNLWQ